jgi:uncharacterized protein YkwD
MTSLARWSAPVVLAIAVVACSPDEGAVLTDRGSGDAADQSSQDAGAGQEPIDDLALRAPSGSATTAGLGAAANGAQGDTAPTIGPPTLPPGADTDQTTVTSASTIAPTTVTAPPAPSSPSTATTPQAAAGGQTTPSETAPATVAQSAPASTADVAQLETGEVQSLTLLNDLRVSLGLAAVNRDPEMDAFARDWSRQMAESQRFEHSDGPYGENIAFTSNTELTAAEASELFHQLWVESPDHYSNMANERYTASGVGLYLTPNGWYGTHVFKF